MRMIVDYCVALTAASAWCECAAIASSVSTCYDTDTQQEFRVIELAFEQPELFVGACATESAANSDGGALLHVPDNSNHLEGRVVLLCSNPSYRDDPLC